MVLVTASVVVVGALVMTGAAVVVDTALAVDADRVELVSAALRTEVVGRVLHAPRPSAMAKLTTYALLRGRPFALREAGGAPTLGRDQGL